MRFVALLALLLAGLLALLLPHLGVAPFERAEIYFLDAARGMVESGDWLVPRYQGEPFFDKPALTYWLMATSMSELGATPAAGRLVSVAAALGAVVSTVWLGTLLFGRGSALTGGLVLATTLLFLSFGRIAMSDMLLVLWTTLAVALGVRACRPKPPAWIVPALGVALGLGFLTKGPIALVVAGAALLLLVLACGRRPLPVAPISLALGGLGFLVLGFGWFALLYRRLGPEPLVFFFLRENLERFGGEAYDVGRPVWFYLPAYLGGGLPWSAFLPVALLRLLPGRGDGAFGARLLAGWCALVLAALSLSRGKVDYYLLPLLPPLSLLLGHYLSAVPWGRLDRTWARTVLLAGAAAIALTVVRPPAVPEAWLPGTGARLALGAALVLTAVALLVIAVRPAPGRIMAALAAGSAATWLVLAGLFLPSFTEAQPNHAIVADVARERAYRRDLALVFCSDRARVRRDVLFQLRLVAVETCEIESAAGSSEPHLLLLTPSESASLRSVPGYRHIGTYAYLPARTLTLDGLLHIPPPAEVVLVANFETKDPVADRKRRKEYRQMLKRGGVEGP